MPPDQHTKPAKEYDGQCLELVAAYDEGLAGEDAVHKDLA